MQTGTDVRDAGDGYARLDLTRGDSLQQLMAAALAVRLPAAHLALCCALLCTTDCCVLVFVHACARLRMLLTAVPPHGRRP